MSKLLRRWIVWLTVLLLPLQGLAASGMWLCAALHGQPTQAVQAAHDQAQAMAQHTGHVDHAAHAGHAGGIDADSDTHHDTSTRCSACAACCVGLGPLLAPAVLGRLDAAHDVAAPPLMTPASALVAEPEKPPRSLRA